MKMIGEFTKKTGLFDDLEAHRLFLDAHQEKGFTYDPLFARHAPISSGYIASEAGGAILDASPMADYVEFLAAYKALRLKCLDYMASGREAYIGGWMDDGKLYLDVSRVFKSRRGAMSFARREKQISIYDAKGDKVIYVH